MARFHDLVLVWTCDLGLTWFRDLRLARIHDLELRWISNLDWTWIPNLDALRLLDLEIMRTCDLEISLIRLYASRRNDLLTCDGAGSDDLHTRRSVADLDGEPDLIIVREHVLDRLSLLAVEMPRGLDQGVHVAPHQDGLRGGRGGLRVKEGNR